MDPSDFDQTTPLAAELQSLSRRRLALRNSTLPSLSSPRIITVANQKGGVGKTTTAVNIASSLAHFGNTVLVVDLDPQGNASTALGIDQRVATESIYNSVVGSTAVEKIIQVSPENSRLICAPSNLDLAGAEIELVSMANREYQLQTALKEFLASEVGSSIEYVIVDCPPSLGLLTLNALVAAQEVLVPIQCEYYALEGVSQLVKNIELIRNNLNSQLSLGAILLTMFDSRTKLSQQVEDDVRSHFPEKTLKTVIPRSVRVSEAPSYGQTVITHDKGSSGAVAYQEAAIEIAERGVVR